MCGAACPSLPLTAPAPGKPPSPLRTLISHTRHSLPVPTGPGPAGAPQPRPTVLHLARHHPFASHPATTKVSKPNRSQPYVQFTLSLDKPPAPLLGPALDLPHISPLCHAPPCSCPLAHAHAPGSVVRSARPSDRTMPPAPPRPPRCPFLLTPSNHTRPAAASPSSQLTPRGRW